MLIVKSTFGSDIEANLVANLLKDKSAEPNVSLLAFYNNEAIGHILFTRAYINNRYSQTLVHILAPLAVIPSYQNQGVGGQLISAGLEILKKIGSELVFVLGYTVYYSKFGFIPDAKSLGFPTPFPILEEHAPAWMVKSMTKNGLNIYQGKIDCAEEMNKIEYWTE